MAGESRDDREEREEGDPLSVSRSSLSPPSLRVPLIACREPASRRRHVLHRQRLSLSRNSRR